MSRLTGLYGFAKNTVLRAGAGTGKTEALTTVYLHLVSGLADGEAWGRAGLLPERIVALTFTEKAATEMRERIAEAVSLLANDALPPALGAADEASRARAARSYCAARGYSAAVAARLCALAASAVAQGRALPPPELWRRVGFSLGRARVGTFHGFAAGALRGAASAVGADPDFRVLEPPEAERLLREAAVGALSDAARAHVAAVADLMAAAGGIDADGERGLVPRVVELVQQLDEQGLADDEVRYGAAVEASPPLVVAVCDRVAALAAACEGVASLRDDGAPARLYALRDALAALSAGASDGARFDAALARSYAVALAAHPLPPAGRARRVEHEYEAAASALAALREAALCALSSEVAERARGVLLETRARYRAMKRARAALDYADLLRLLRDAWRDKPALRRAWKSKVDAVLVDEFQDTNRVQRDLLYLLRERRDRERDLRGASEVALRGVDLEPHGLLLVGDAKQSIYAFRGADVRVFLETEEDLAASGAARLELTDSHRALEEVLEAVNPVTEALLGKGLTAYREGLYDRARDALRAEAQGDGRARVELLLVPEGTADEVRDHEARALARRIRALTEAPAGDDPSWRPARLDEIAVLVPSWTHIDALRRAFREAHVPYALLGGPGFWERREVDDLVVLLRFAADPTDALALAAVLRGPLVGLSDAGIARVFSMPGTLDEQLDPAPAVRLGLDEADRERLAEARPTLRRVAAHGALLGPAAVLRMALRERGLAAVLATQPFGAQKVANVDKLVGLADSAEERGGDDATVAGFVRYVDRARAAAQHETEANVADVAAGAVQVLSMHAAKGLEWPVVFVAQSARRRKTHGERLLVDGARRVLALPAGFDAPEPYRMARQDAHAAEDDDQRRLLYVALTRARDLAVVSGPQADGEGEWQALSAALLREAPQRVRVVRAGDEAAQPLLVRERFARDDVSEALPAPRAQGVPLASNAPPREDPPRAGEGAPGAAAAGGAARRALPVLRERAVGLVGGAVSGPEALAPARALPRRLALDAGALDEFAACPRRYHARRVLGLREPGAGRALVDEAARALFALVDRDAWGQRLEPRSGPLYEAAGALGDRFDAATLEAACARLAALGGTAEGRALTSAGRLSDGAALALALDDGGPGVLLHVEVDALVDAGALGLGEGLVAVLVGASAPSAGLEREALALEVAAAALAQRLEDAGGEPTRTLAAVLHPRASGEGYACAALRPDESRGALRERLERRVRPLAAALREAHATQRYAARERAHCEREGCGFVLRCHRA